MQPGILVAATSVDLVHEPLPPAQVVAGAPTTGTLVLDDAGGVETGVWEMTPGTATDTEADELFIVIAGRATVVFDKVPDAASPPEIDLIAGSVVRLTHGMRTTWTVHETLRKLYFATSPQY
jgi:hypothetical protein